MAEITKSDSTHEALEKIKQGFRINYLTMGNAETGEIFWKLEDCHKLHDSSEELEANIPKKILKCRIVSRDVNFSSEELIKRLKLVQYVYLQDQITETLEFKFGFVIP